MKQVSKTVFSHPKPWPNDRNISTHHIATLLGATCCVRLATLLRCVATCCDMLDVDVAWCCSRLARLGQQCCTRACALVRFYIPNMSQHVATGLPNARNMLRPTMLRYVVLKCCDMFGVVGSNLTIFKFEPTTPNMSQHGGQTHATCCAQQCCDMLCWNVAIVWPELANAGPTMLGYVVLICCDRLAGALDVRPVLDHTP